MATFKRPAKKTTRRRAAADGTPQDRVAAALTGSAQQIWLAGVGALGRAQAEGSRLFEGLVREGVSLEKTARDLAGRAEVVRDVVETGVGQARERATDTWDRLEKVFEDRVQRALIALGVPGRDDLRDLSQRVDTLTAELRRQNAGAATGARRQTGPRAAVKQPAAASTPRKTTTASKSARGPAATARARTAVDDADPTARPANGTRRRRSSGSASAD